MEEVKAAMRAQDRVRLDALRYLLSLVKNAEIDKHEELNDEEITKLIQSEIKKREKAIEMISKAKREDLVVEEKAKVKVLLSL